jgi:hypothetical protein
MFSATGTDWSSELAFRPHTHIICGYKQYQISMGIAFTGYHFKINEDEIRFEDPNEPWMNNELRRGIFVPDADFGIYVLNPRYNFGFSTQQIFGAAAKIGEDAYSNYRMDRHYYFLALTTLWRETKPNSSLQPF